MQKGDDLAAARSVVPTVSLDIQPSFFLAVLHPPIPLALLSSSLTPSLSSRLYNNRDEFLRADTFRSLPLTISSRFECLLGVS